MFWSDHEFLKDFWGLGIVLVFLFGVIALPLCFWLFIALECVLSDNVYFHTFEDEML